MRINAIRIPFTAKRSVLAFGSQAKNTLCFLKGSVALISRVHSDLSDPENFADFEKDARYLLRKNPQVIAYDRHPEYSSSSFAHALRGHRLKDHPVFHHHAHICACMAENAIKDQEVIGVAFDGTGLGLDNGIWGAEFLACDYSKFKRVAHLKEIPLAGAQQAISEPWRLAAFWLYQAYGNKFSGLKISWLRKLDLKKWNIIKEAAQKGINSPLASSAGRLFDAAASLILGKAYAEHEAQLPIELERLAGSWKLEVGRISTYAFRIKKEGNKYVIDPAGLFKGIVKDLKAKKPKKEIAYKFHLSVAKIIEKTCIVLSKKSRINKVVLSGGVFQNKLLLEISKRLLNESDFEVFYHKRFSPGDASLSLGQAVIAGRER